MGVLIGNELWRRTGMNQYKNNYLACVPLCNTNSLFSAKKCMGAHGSSPWGGGNCNAVPQVGPELQFLHCDSSGEGETALDKPYVVLPPLEESQLRNQTTGTALQDLCGFGPRYLRALHKGPGPLRVCLKGRALEKKHIGYAMRILSENY